MGTCYGAFFKKWRRIDSEIQAIKKELYKKKKKGKKKK